MREAKNGQELYLRYIKIRRNQRILACIIILLLILFGIQSAYIFTTLGKCKDCSSQSYDYTKGNLSFSVSLTSSTVLRGTRVEIIFTLRNIGNTTVRVLPFCSGYWTWENYKVAHPIAFKFTNSSSGEIMKPNGMGPDIGNPSTEDLFLLPPKHKVYAVVMVILGSDIPSSSTLAFRMPPGTYYLEARYISWSNITAVKDGFITLPYWTGELDAVRVKFTLV